MAEYDSVLGRVRDVKKAIASRFCRLIGRNQALTRKTLSADLEARGVAQQDTADAIDELLRAGLLATVEQRLNELQQQSAELRFSCEQWKTLLALIAELRFSREQWEALFAVIDQPSDALFASDGLKELIKVASRRVDDCLQTTAKELRCDAVDDAIDEQADSSLDVLALARFVEDPNRTKIQLAALLGCNEKSLAPSRCPKLSAAIAVHRAPDLPRGFKDSHGNIDSYEVG